VFSVRWRELGDQLPENSRDAVPGSVTTVEGYNEINNAVTYDDKGCRAAAAGQKAIMTLKRSCSKTCPGHRHDWLRRMKDPTSPWYVAQGIWDLMNHHAYPRMDSNRAVDKFKVGQQSDGRADAKGHHGMVARARRKAVGSLSVSDERTQAKGILNGLFDAARSGYDKIYFYELLDQKPDPDLKELELHFGFFTFDNRPKIAAHAIRNLTRILGDDGNPDASRRTPGQPVQVTVQGPDSKEQIYTLELKKSDGRRLAAIWRETPFWDRTGQPLEATPVPAKVSFGNA
jgi:hypothetical protein